MKFTCADFIDRHPKNLRKTTTTTDTRARDEWQLARKVPISSR